jgi:hypothetical protein
LRIPITVFSQLVDTLRSASAQILESPEDNRFSRTNFRACGRKAALLPVIAEGAFEGASSIWQRFRPPIDHAERARHHAVAAAVAHIVLHQDRADLCAHDGTGWTGFKATGFFAMLANIGKKNPPKRVFSIAVAQRVRSDDLTSFLSILLNELHVTPC